MKTPIEEKQKELLHKKCKQMADTISSHTRSGLDCTEWLKKMVLDYIAELDKEEKSNKCWNCGEHISYYSTGIPFYRCFCGAIEPSDSKQNGIIKNCDSCAMFTDGCQLDVSICPDCFEHSMWTEKQSDKSAEYPSIDQLIPKSKINFLL